MSCFNEGLVLGFWDGILVVVSIFLLSVGEDFPFGNRA